MKNFFSVCLLTASVFVLPTSAVAQSLILNESASQQHVSVTALIASLLQQIANLQIQLEQLQAQDTTAVSFTDSVVVKAVYPASTEREIASIANKAHRQYMQRIAVLFPSDYVNKINQFLVFENQKNAIDAYVETIAPLHNSWVFAVNEAVVGEVDSVYGTTLIIHEFAHVLSYETILGVPLPAISHCDAYFKLHGCPLKNSYLGEFVAVFWQSDDLQRATNFAGAANSFEAEYSYYLEHESEYVSDYAVQSPEEDFAESFTAFVLQTATPAHSIVRQKIEFFESYPALLELREEIQSELVW